MAHTIDIFKTELSNKNSFFGNKSLMNSQNKIPVKIEKKYIMTNGTAILHLRIHPLIDLNIKVGHFIEVSPKDMESVILLEATPVSPPYWDK